MFDLTFTVDAQDTTTPLTLAIDQMVIAGWTGRDPVARDKHIAELQEMGIAPPARAIRAAPRPVARPTAPSPPRPLVRS